MLWPLLAFVQKRFEEAEKRADRDWMDEAEVLQRQVVEEHGFSGDKAETALYRLRIFALRHPELALQVRLCHLPHALSY